MQKVSILFLGHAPRPSAPARSRDGPRTNVNRLVGRIQHQYRRMHARDHRRPDGRRRLPARSACDVGSSPPSGIVPLPRHMISLPSGRHGHPRFQHPSLIPRKRHHSSAYGLAVPTNTLDAPARRKIRAHSETVVPVVKNIVNQKHFLRPAIFSEGWATVKRAANILRDSWWRAQASLRLCDLGGVRQDRNASSRRLPTRCFALQRSAPSTSDWLNPRSRLFGSVQWNRDHQNWLLHQNPVPNSAIISASIRPQQHWPQA